MNPAAGRFVHTAKLGSLARLILFGLWHLTQARKEFVAHYRIERPHQGLGKKVLTASASEPSKDGDMANDERLGGLLRSQPAIGLTAARIAKLGYSTTHRATGLPLPPMTEPRRGVRDQCSARNRSATFPDSAPSPATARASVCTSG